MGGLRSRPQTPSKRGVHSKSYAKRKKSLARYLHTQKNPKNILGTTWQPPIYCIYLEHKEKRKSLRRILKWDLTTISSLNLTHTRHGQNTRHGLTIKRKCSLQLLTITPTVEILNNGRLQFFRVPKSCNPKVPEVCTAGIAQHQERGKARNPLPCHPWCCCWIKVQVASQYVNKCHPTNGGWRCPPKNPPKEGYAKWTNVHCCKMQCKMQKSQHNAARSQWGVYTKTPIFIVPKNFPEWHGDCII